MVTPPASFGDMGFASKLLIFQVSSLTTAGYYLFYQTKRIRKNFIFAVAKKQRKRPPRGFRSKKSNNKTVRQKHLNQASLWVFLVEVPLPPLLVDLWCALRVLASVGHLLVRPVAVARPIPSSALGPTGGVHILDSEIFRKLQKRKTSWWLNQTIWNILISQIGIISPSFGLKFQKYLSCHPPGLTNRT